MSTAIKITDVTLRDGLQDQPQVLSTADKIQIADLLVQAGYHNLELGSFMRADRVPQMADTEAFLAAWPTPSHIRRHVLVPNARGLDRALTTDADTLVFVVSASNAHNRANLNRSTDESLEALIPLVRRAKDNGRQVLGAVSTAFGCPYQGAISPAEVSHVMDAYLNAGVDGVILADTIGSATPPIFTEILHAAVTRIGPSRIGLHLHDSGTGLEPLIDIALDAGIFQFDTAIGGLGGCPFAPGAPGNLKAEDLIPYLNSKGYTTGIDYRKLPTIALSLGIALGQHTVRSDTLHP